MLNIPVYKRETEEKDENVKGVEVKNGAGYQKSCKGIALDALAVGRHTFLLAIKSKEEGRMMVERLWLNFR